MNTTYRPGVTRLGVRELRPVVMEGLATTSVDSFEGVGKSSFSGANHEQDSPGLHQRWVTMHHD